jgi:hypothetical protein
MDNPESSQKAIIGSTEYVSVEGIEHVPAKIDTGADSSSIWASNIDVKKDGTLTFCLFDEKSPFYTGETIKRKDFKVLVVRNSTGIEQMRYRTELEFSFGGKSIKTMFTLANRSRNNFPVLVGRKTLEGNFLVDVAIRNVIKSKNPKTFGLNKELEKDPYAFHRKYGIM